MRACHWCHLWAIVRLPCVRVYSWRDGMVTCIPSIACLAPAGRALFGGGEVDTSWQRHRNQGFPTQVNYLLCLLKKVNRFHSLGLKIIAGGVQQVAGFEAAQF